MSTPDNDIGVLINPDLAALHPSPTNPRTVFDDEGLAELAESIRRDGVMTPILVRELTPEQRTRMGTDKPLEIVAGERRYRASLLAGMQTIPAVLRDLDDATVERLQIVENLQREGLNPIDEAEGYERLRAQGMSIDEISQQVGKSGGRSKAYVYAKLKLLALTDVARNWLRRGDMTEAVALLVARFPPALQGRALSRATQPDLDGERPSYRAVKRILREQMMVRLDARTLQFDPTAPDLLPDTPSCTSCPSRMGTDPSCDQELADVCTDTACYARKTAAGVGAQQTARDAADAALCDTPSQADAPSDHPEDTLDMDAPSANTPEISADVAQAEASFTPTPAPASTPPAASQAPTRRIDYSAPLRKAWGEYRDAVAEQIVSNPPLFVAGPLLREVAYQLSQDSNYHLPMDCSDADAMIVILRIITEHLAHHAYGSRSGVVIEDIAEMVGIDHARILQETLPVPDGCARPNEHGVYEAAEELTKQAGGTSISIALARTAEGWRAAYRIKTADGYRGSGINISDQPHPTREDAINAEAQLVIQSSKLDNIPNKERWALCTWLESIATGEAEPDTQAKPTSTHHGAPIRYRHPDNPAINWTGRGKKGSAE